MAFVLLPCDLFSWDDVTTILNQLLENPTARNVAKTVWELHRICGTDSGVPRDGTFKELERFFQQNVHRTFLEDAIPKLIRISLQLRHFRMTETLYYSLQQQEQAHAIPRYFGASLLGHIFLCTFPPRSELFHPSLVNPSFVHLFTNLHRRSQQLKLASFLNYFRLLPDFPEIEGNITVTRKVRLTTLEKQDWLSSTTSLCDIKIQNSGSIQNFNGPGNTNCFSTEFPCKSSLTKGNGQEASITFTHPEMLLTSIICEKMNWNEVVEVHGLLCVSSIQDLQKDPNCSLYDKFIESETKFSMIDPMDYSEDPVVQYLPDNVLRELNKCLVGFGEKQTKKKMSASRRQVAATSQLPSTSSAYDKQFLEPIIAGRQTVLDGKTEQASVQPSSFNPPNTSTNPTLERLRTAEDKVINQRASKPPLPPTRTVTIPKRRPNISFRASVQTSSEEDYFSAQESLGKNGECRNDTKLSPGTSVEKKHRKLSFTQRLKEAADREQAFLEQAIKEEACQDLEKVPLRKKISPVQKRLETKLSVGSSLDIQEPQSPSRYKNLMEDPAFKAQEMKDSGNSTERSHSGNLRTSWYISDDEISDPDSYSCSLSSDYNSSSDDEDGYDGLEEILHGLEQNPEERRLELERQSHSTLKRGFSDTFREMQESQPTPISPLSHKRSLSLHGQSTIPELQRHISSNSQNEKHEEHNIITGNWGCGSRGGDPQLKVLLQWAAGSFLGVPAIKYYTYNTSSLTKLSIIIRMISDRGWKTGQLVDFLLNFGEKKTGSILEQDPSPSNESILDTSDTTCSTINSTLFDEVIGPLRTPSFPEREDCDSFSFDFQSDF